MIVEIRDVEDNNVKTVFEKANPFDVRITVGNAIFKISENNVMTLTIRTDGRLTIRPVNANTIEIGKAEAI